MRQRSLTVLVVLAGGLATQQIAIAQRHEIGLTLGAITGATRSSPQGSLDFGTGIALQANYGYVLRHGRKVDLLGEVHFLANPLREIASANRLATHDVATLYVVPGVRVKFRPAARIAPYLAIGGGWALYEQSLKQIDGSPNPAPRFTNRGAIGFGGGADFHIWRYIGGRWEIRDFYSGNPSFNTPVVGSGQHNLVVGGGFVLHLGRREQ